MILIDYTSVCILKRSFSYRFNRLHRLDETMIGFSGVFTLIDYQVIIINYLSLKSVLEVIKNTLINYIKNLIDYIVLESFPVFGKNTLID